MDYEKAYKKALERAKKNYDVAQDLCNGSQIGVERFKNTLTNIFPELGESEYDEYERIRKRLIDLIYKVYAFTNYITCVEYENIIAWLEKQGDTTSDIRYDGVNAGASLSVVNGKPFDYEHATITQKDFASVGETATIELSSPIDCGDRIYHVSHKPIEKQGEQKQEWSEEDEEMAEDLIKGCVSAEKAYHFLHTPKEVSDWLKSLKDRVKEKEERHGKSSC